jgi:prevent-host-death family protein
MTAKQRPATVSLQDLEQRVREIVDRVQRSGEAVVVTDRGRPAAVLVSLEAYEQDARDRLLLRLLALGELESAANQGHDLDEVMADADDILNAN